MIRKGCSDSNNERQRPTPEETLRLLDSFNRIASDEMRETVLALAQRYASKSRDFNRAMQKLLAKVGTTH